VLASIGLVLVMVVLTAYSQYGMIPTMEKDRLTAANGAIDSLPADDPARLDFNRLHKRSETVEEAVVLLGLIVVALIANAETAAANRA